MAEIVHDAHRQGVVHGRLHPGNVLFSDVERIDVLVGDWVDASVSAELPDEYVPPERWTEGDVDLVAIDVYQLGVLAVHALTGRPHSAADPSTWDATAMPEPLPGVLQKALAPEPDDRYESALAFRDMLRWAGL